MKLSIGFSPCPNDTFIFDAMINGKVDTRGLEFEPVLEDVETLNQWALEGKLQVTKLSYPAFFESLDKYILLDSGSAMGRAVGPLLVSASGKEYDDAAIEHATIAIPGIHTTANLLLGFAFPNAIRKLPMVFSSIEDAVLNGMANLGVIIHENRFTYMLKGLQKIMDLGEYWESRMHIPIPLGGIAMKRELDEKICRDVQEIIRESLRYAFSNYPEITSYVKQHSQSMSDDVMRKHIDLYVNNYSISLGSEGQEAIRVLLDTFLKMKGGKSNLNSYQLFLDGSGS